MSKFENLSARRFGKLVVIERAPDSNGKTMWLCKCDCGTHKVIPAYRLKRGETTSCGCANRLDVQIAPKQRYGALETICLAPGKGRKRYWLCRCDCGNLKYIAEYSLQTGQSRSCGCLRNQLIGAAGTKHGGTGSRLFVVWSSMKQRCNDPNHSSYKNYGLRGIRVCDEWASDYGAFRDWALANGYDESAARGECTIDRIDANGNYEPSNCRWVDMKVQAANRRSHTHKPTRTSPVVRVDDGGNETMFDSIIEAARALGSEHKRSLICDCCRGKRPTAYGYEWRYA